MIEVDSTGDKVTNKGEWVRKKRKGYIKIHVKVDIKGKQVVSIKVMRRFMMVRRLSFW